MSQTISSELQVDRNDETGTGRFDSSKGKRGEKKNSPSCTSGGTETHSGQSPRSQRWQTHEQYCFGSAPAPFHKHLINLI